MCIRDRFEVGETKNFPYSAFAQYRHDVGKERRGSFMSGHGQLKLIARSKLKWGEKGEWITLTGDIDFQDVPGPANVKCRNDHFTSVIFADLPEIRADDPPKIRTECDTCGETILAKFSWNLDGNSAVDPPFIAGLGKAAPASVKKGVPSTATTAPIETFDISIDPRTSVKMRGDHVDTESLLQEHWRNSKSMVFAVAIYTTPQGLTTDVTEDAPWQIEAKPGEPTVAGGKRFYIEFTSCLLYTSPSPRDATLSRMPSSA